VFFIKKKDGSLQLVQDYHVLNAVTVKNKYPLPLISELVSQLHRAKYFTKLVVCWDFNNVHIKPGDEWKVAFCTNCSLFEPLVMFFGMTNSPTTFQTMINDIFRTLIAEGIIVVYLDNILIFTRMEEEHKQAVQRVLEVLAEHKLFLHLEKCEFYWKEIEYLRLVIVTNFIQPYLHQFFNYSHCLNGYRKPLKRPFDRYQSRLKVISIGRDIRQINW